MGFAEAVQTCLQQYVGFSGRARRSEYWWFFLFTILVSIVASVLDSMLGTMSDDTNVGLIGTIASLALLLPSIAVAIRRLHDTSRSGWWILIGLIPIVGWIILIVFYCPGQPRREPVRPFAEGCRPGRVSGHSATYVVYGAGAVGGVIGGHLALAGHETTLVARGEHLTADPGGRAPAGHGCRHARDPGTGHRHRR